MNEKKRLDILIKERYKNFSKNQIQNFIIQGKIKIDNKIITKPGSFVPVNANIQADIEEPKYVSRAGFKLEKALNYFSINVNDKVILDAGLSTGGFTDCLIQRGAKKVYGVDVGSNQVHEKIRSYSNVIILEKTNLRYLVTLDEKVDIVTLDLSFISILKVIDAVKNLMKDNAELITLIKPQFETDKDQIPSNGVIKDPELHKKIVEHVVKEIKEKNFKLIGLTESPIEGSSGNKEFLAYFIRC
ncbi:TlyA family RNA methyltransferase [Candidatus Babela massiliensis]|uniref:16S/23S rRNA (Cytidine-2'-O)-methyltransferase TlyA n=1 Tax=Candidatus Babela massiliensis TaxID=673862 RepID=V6DHL5_9BACT|nr:TlyA family RNA methyltransferase [Candidatus Babela massiliensis]CDK31040.1 16S/23S rRNA (cytidine-2'-O)-methyltransferase TlyA [Candidatus Babela massiliensis]